MNSLIKKLLIGGVLAAPVFLMSYTPEQPKAATVSEEAPELALTTGDSTISLRRLHGKTVILHFWSKSDPVSRVANHFNDLKASKSSADTVYIAVCTDLADENLSRMIAREDGNRDSSQFFRSQLAPSSNTDAYTVSGNGTWVISPEGVILSRSFS